MHSPSASRRAHQSIGISSYSSLPTIRHRTRSLIPTRIPSPLPEVLGGREGVLFRGGVAIFVPIELLHSRALGFAWRKVVQFSLRGPHRNRRINSIQESGYTVATTRSLMINLGSTQVPPSRLDFTAASTNAMPMAPSSTVAHSMGTPQLLPRIFASRAREASE